MGFRVIALVSKRLTRQSTTHGYRIESLRTDRDIVNFLRLVRCCIADSRHGGE
jgi:hypothetical protein